jgi:PhoH-like ATPase
MGEDIGFLPGGIDEKFAPWMMPIRDNMRLILGDEMDTGKPLEYKGKVDPLTELMQQNVIEISPTIYIRGRSIRNCYVVVDESQNLTPHQAKTVASRAGEGTKVVFTGDVEQIDNPRVDSISNGFVYTAESLKDTPYIAHITLVKSERSRLAELVAARM